MPWRREIARWRTYMQTAGFPETTIGLRTYHLERLAREVKGTPSSVTLDQLTTWLASKNWQPNTRRAYRSSLRSFYSWALATGTVTESPAHLLPPVKVPRRKARPTPEPVYRRATMTASRRTWRAIRLGGHCGLRRFEIAKVRREDVLPSPEGPNRWHLHVIGKGGHERFVPLPTDLAEDLLSCPPGWIFPSSHGGHLTPHHLAKTVTAELDGYTTHTLRHRCGTKAYNEGGKDIRAVQELLGHANLATVHIYTEIPPSAIRAAMEGAA